MKILVIRGGGLGDFIVTLPMFRMLRERWPQAHIELLGQPGIAQMALDRYYLNAVRSADHGPFARFFAKGAELDRDWMDYMRSFDLVVSYFFDPDDIFQANLERCGLVPWEGNFPDEGDVLKKRWLLRADPRIQSSPAARQLCEPLRALGLKTEDFSSRLFPNDEDIRNAKKLLPATKDKLVALHPGSGSPLKNWPLRCWVELVKKIELEGFIPVIVGGEADVEQLNLFSNQSGVVLLRNLPLPILAATIQLCDFYIGHDTGVTHMAAAVGTPCVVLFGPTDPKIWAPSPLRGTLLKSSVGLEDLAVEAVWRACLEVKDLKV